MVDKDALRKQELLSAVVVRKQAPLYRLHLEVFVAVRTVLRHVRSVGILVAGLTGVLLYLRIPSPVASFVIGVRSRKLGICLVNSDGISLDGLRSVSEVHVGSASSQSPVSTSRECRIVRS